MIEKVVTSYRKIQMGVIGSFSETSAQVMYEAGFYDDGYLQAEIARVQKELKKVTDELKLLLKRKEASEYDVEQRDILKERRTELLFSMIFLASNRFSNLEDCIHLAEGYSFPFMQCIYALKAYYIGNKVEAYRLLEEYYKEYKTVEGHYLVNKVFAFLLKEKGFYQKAIPFFTYALQFVPDDTECLEKLSECCKHANDVNRMQVVNEVLEILR